MKLFPINSNFLAGEVSPQVSARVDLPRYPNALATCENFVIKPYGGAYRRDGTEQVETTKSGGKARLIAFEHSEWLNYVFEFGDNYVRAIKDGRQLQNPPVNKCANGTFDTTPGGWTLGATWGIAAGVATFGPAAGTLTRDCSVVLDMVVRVTYDIVAIEHDAITMSIGGVAGTARTTVGTYSEYITCTGAGALTFTPAALTHGTIDNVIVEQFYINNGDFKVAFAGTGWAFGFLGAGTVSQDLPNHHLTLEPGTTPGDYVDLTYDNPQLTIGDDYVLSFEVITGTVQVHMGSHASDARDLMDYTTFGPGIYYIPFRARVFSTEVRFYQEAGDGDVEIDNVYYYDAVPLEFTTTYSADEIGDLQVYGYDSKLYIVHPNHKPATLTRNDSDDDWTLADCEFEDGPFNEEIDCDITVTVVSGDIDTPGSIVDLQQHTADDEIWDAGHVGALFRLGDSDENEWGIVKITTYSTPWNVHAEIVDGLPSAGIDIYREGCWSDYRGWPRAIGFYESRLVLGFTESYPQRIWGSMTALPLSFKQRTTDDASWDYTLASRQGNRGFWISSMNEELIAGTMSGPVRMSGGEGNPLTPTNVRSNQAEDVGCYPMAPLEIGGEILFVQRSGIKLRNLSFMWDQNKYHAPDLTRGAEHMTLPGIVQMAWQPEPDYLLWVVRNDGILAVMTYDQDDQVYAWHRQVLGGDVESVAKVHSPTGKRDDVYVIVNREAGRFIERFNPDLMTDAGKLVRTSSATIIYGFDHLIGEKLDVKVGGVFIGQKTVGTTTLSGADFGTITLDAAGTSVEAGIHYDAEAETLKPEIITQQGSSRGRRKSWKWCGVEVYLTQSVTINGKKISFFTRPFTLGAGPTAVTKLKKVDIAGWDDDATVTFESTEPYPCNIMAVVGELEIADW